MKTNKWQYDELRQIGVDYANLEEVEKYDARMRKLRDINAEINTLVEAVTPARKSIILELGTGTGEFATALAKLCRKVVAVDVSPVMLEYAWKKAQSRKISNIDFRHAGFLTFKEAPEQFDLVFTQLALHHLPDFWKAIALKNIHALLKEGGKFFLKDVVYPSAIDDYTPFFNGIIQGIENSVGAEFTKEIIAHVKKEYSTLDWILEGMLKKAGFSILETNVDNGFIYTYLCVK